MKKKDNAIAEFRHMLREHGYKATPARLLVLELLGRTGSPQSAQSIIEHLENAMDQATVYRTLKTLKKEGLITQVDLRHNHAHFELAGMKDHHHLVCTQCGRVEDFTGCNFESIAKKALAQSKEFAEITQHSFELFGMCRHCSKQ